MPHARKLSAILAADVVGYSAMMERDESATLETLTRLRTTVIAPLVDRHGGRIFKLMGDGLLAEFASVIEAVEAAAEIQRDLAAAGGMVLRIGINLGDVIVEGDDLHGDGVNVAARLQQLARPGGVAVSGAAFDQLRGKSRHAFADGGEQQLKNISRPVRVHHLGPGTAPVAAPPARTSRRPGPRAAVAAAAVLASALAAAWWALQPPAPTGLPMVAVLPFENYGQEETTGRLADGLTEDIVTDLAAYRDFEVLARNSTERYRGQAVDVQKVARELGADFVLEGSIQHQSGTLRITAQLISADTGSHVWSERWDRPDSDFFTVQSEIAQAVSNTLGGGRRLINATELEAAKRKPPKSLSAYELRLMGGEQIENGDTASLKEAVALLKRAIALDPEFADAWRLLNVAYDMLAYAGVDPEVSWKLAADAARQAVRLDPNNPLAHIAMASVYGQRNDFEAIKTELDMALRLAPNSAEVLTHYANWAAAVTDPAVGAEMADRAIRLDPAFPAWAATRFLSAYYYAERFEDAVRIGERIPADAFFPDTWFQYPSVLAMTGRADEATAWVKKALAANPDLSVEWWVNQPSYPDRDRALTERTMRAAGFPLCATSEKRAQLGSYWPIKECAKAPTQDATASP
jgi:TolB-like protein/class 3 adenylate cyclase